MVTRGSYYPLYCTLRYFKILKFFFYSTAMKNYDGPALTLVNLRISINKGATLTSYPIAWGHGERERERPY